MAISVKTVRRPEGEVSYLRATLKGMAVTLSHVFRPKVTMEYPEQKSTDDWTLSPRWRGTHRMLTDEQGRAKCVACGLGPQICPADCLKVGAGGGGGGDGHPPELETRAYAGGPVGPQGRGTHGGDHRDLLSFPTRRSSDLPRLAHERVIAGQRPVAR